MIFSVLPKTVVIGEPGQVPGSLALRALLESFAAREGKPIAFLSERAVSYDGHDWDVVIRKRDRVEVLLRLR